MSNSEPVPDPRQSDASLLVELGEPGPDTGEWAEELAQRIASVRERIAAAAERSGRNPEEVTLLPVTKTVPASRLLPLLDLGYNGFGENRVQELRTKSEELAGLGVSWHLIGRLQTKKAGQAARTAGVIESVDSLRLAESLSRGAVAAERQLELFLQVNTSGEEVKAGFEPTEVGEALARTSELPGITVTGLMTMAPFTDNRAWVRQTFADLRILRDSLQSQGFLLPNLSMGMTQDFEIAVEEGSTHVRVGSALFGSPPRTPTALSRRSIRATAQPSDVASLRHTATTL